MKQAKDVEKLRCKLNTMLGNTTGKILIAMDEKSIKTHDIGNKNLK